MTLSEEFLSKKKKNRKLSEEFLEKHNRTDPFLKDDEEKIVKKDKEDTNSWFKKSELYNDDKGNVVTDTIGTAGATIGDAGTNLL